MAGGTNQQLAQQLEAFQIGTAGARIKAEDFLKMSAAQLLARFLMLMLYDEGAEEPLGCVLGEAGGLGDHLAVAKGAGDLDWTVEPGVGFVFDSSEVATSSPHVSNAYIPAVLTAQASGTLSTYSGFQRIDIVVLTPNPTDDTSESRAARSLVNGTLTVPDPTVNTRHQLTGTISIVEGTPAATPAAPATPAGSLKLAELLVPTSGVGGPLTVTDTRQFASLGEAFRGPPLGHFYEPHILPGEAPGLTAGASAVSMDAVRCVTPAMPRFVPATTINTTAPIGALTRIDLITINTAGAYEVVQGTPSAGTPAQPATPAGHILMWTYEIAGTTGVKSNVTVHYTDHDAPIDTPQIEDEAITTALIADDAVSTAKIAPGAVDTTELADDAVTRAKVASQTIPGWVPGTAFVPCNNPLLDATGDSGQWLLEPNAVYIFETELRLPDPSTLQSVEVYFSSVDNNVNQARLQVLRRFRGVSGAAVSVFDSGFTNIPNTGLAIIASSLAEAIDSDDWIFLRVSIDMDAAATNLGTAFRGAYWTFDTDQLLS